MKPTNTLRSFLLGTIFLSASPLVHAGQNWDAGGGANTNSNLKDNWDGTAPGVLPTAGTLVFGAAGSTVTWNGLSTTSTAVNITGLNFLSTANAFTFNTSGTINIQFVTGTSTAILNSSSFLQTINPNCGVFFNGIKTIDAGTAGLALNGGIQFRGDSMTAGQINTLAFTGTGNSTVGAVNELGFASTSLKALTKSGTGNWTFTGGGNLSGPMTISDGKIVITNALALQNSAYVTTGSNGTTIGLDVSGGLNSGKLTLGGLAGAVNLASAITAGYDSVTNLTLNSQTGQTNTYTGIIANGAVAGMTLTKTGAGAQVLSGLNSYTGDTTVSVGVLQFTGTSAIGSTSKITVSSGAQAYFGGLAAAFSTAITKPIELNGAGPGSGGALRMYVENGVLTFSGTISLLGNSTIFSYAGNCTSTINNPIDGTGDLTFAAGGALKNHNDIFVLQGGSSTYVGNTTISSPGAANAIVRLNGGFLPSATVLTIQDGNASLKNNDAVFDLNGNDQTLVGLKDVAVTGGNGRFVVNGNAGLSTLTVNNTADYTFAGIIGSNNSSGNGQATGTGNIALIKQGNGIQTLSGANSYTGTTTVSAGTLVINGNQSTATGAVAVNGTSTLGGNGTIGGLVTLAAGASLSPGSSVGTLTLGGGLDISAQAAGTGKLVFDLDTLLASDKLAVTGAAAIGSGVLGFSDFTFSNAGALAAGTYTLITTTTGITGTLDSSNLTGTIGSFNAALQITGNNLELVVTSTSSAYDTWALSKGLTGLPGSATDPAKSADPDGDGVNNLAEFAFNGDPLSGSNNGLHALLLQDTAAPAGNELTYIIAVRNGATFTASGFDQTNTTAVDGLFYTVQGSLDLVFPGSTVSHVGSASNTAPVATGLPDLTGSGWEYHTFRLDASEGLPGKGFLRAKVSE